MADALTNEQLNLLHRILPALQEAEQRGQLTTHIRPSINDVSGNRVLPRKGSDELITGNWQYTDQLRVQNDIVATGNFIWASGNDPVTEEGTLEHNNTANRTYTFQDANGTVAFTSDLPTLSDLIPRITTAARLALTPAEGDMVYDTDIQKLFLFTTGWEQITSV